MKNTITAIEPNLLYEVKDDIVYLTLNRQEKRNALSRQLLLELEAAQARLTEDLSVRAVVLGANGKVFCSGHDLSEMIGCSEEAYRELFELCSRVMLQFRRLSQPVMARVQGMATAAGCQLVAACDLAVAAEEAQFATPGIKIGLFCTTPMVPLVRAIPPKPALEMLLTGAPITAQRALELGLINRVVPADQLDETVKLLVNAIRASSPAVVRLGKTAFYEQLGLVEATAYERANDIMTENAGFPDAQEGMQAFLQKRQPEWRKPNPE
jgi:enoyl-CoA hydratase/carnithine racemase